MELALAVGPLRDALTAVLGFFTGMMSALFGIGGATVSTPGIRALGVSAALAVGTTLPSIIPGAASGTFRYIKQQIIDWRVVAQAGTIGAVFSIAGAIATKHMPGRGHIQQIATAALLAFSSFKMWRGLPEPTTAHGPDSLANAGRQSTKDARTIIAAVGAGAGFLSGFLGIGGGVFMVPAFTQYAGLKIKPAIATSLACVGLFSVPGTITHAIEGGIDWRVAAWLTATVVPGALLGAWLSVRATDRRMQLSAAVFLSAIAVVFGVGEIIAL